MKQYSLRVFSRHPSHEVLRKANLKFPVLTCMRLGSTTKGTLPYGIEINTPEAVKTSADKYLMKRAFNQAAVKTALWWEIYYGGDEFEGVLLTSRNGSEEPFNNFDDLKFPMIAKNRWGSRGTGNYKLNDVNQLTAFIEKKKDKLKNYIFEQFFTKGREYRIHVTKDGYFYTCRKMLRKDATEKWHRHDENCVWIKEDNPMFDKPVNWDAIVADCVKALEAIGADVLAFDVKVKLAKNKEGKVRDNPDWILIESCSAPSFGEVTSQKYLEIIPKIIENKLNEKTKEA